MVRSFRVRNEEGVGDGRGLDDGLNRQVGKDEASGPRPGQRREDGVTTG